MYTNPYLWDYLTSLETQIKKLKKANKILKKKAGKHLHIERMEYKIHELHVKSLSGTMNLGVTAQADENTMNDLMGQLTKTGNFNVRIGDQEESKEQTSPIEETPEPNINL